MTFEPKFRIAHDRFEAAHFINEPHEDHPKRVNQTANVIRSLEVTDGVITEDLVRAVHYFVMWDMPEDERGKYRTCEVHINNSAMTPSAAESVPRLMAFLHPLPIRTEDELKFWYKHFQEIHPFADGNGRTGGIILAAISHKLFGYYLAPCQ